MRKKLPKRCAGAIRTLQYIAVANEERSWDDDDAAYRAGSDGASRSDWQSADERYGGGADEYEYRNDWYAEKIKTLRWWRVERIVKGRWRNTKLRPLTQEKGRAVQKFLEEADLESIERIDGKSGLCALLGPLHVSSLCGHQNSCREQSQFSLKSPRGRTAALWTLRGKGKGRNQRNGYLQRYDVL